MKYVYYFYLNDEIVYKTEGFDYIKVNDKEIMQLKYDNPDRTVDYRIIKITEFKKATSSILNDYILNYTIINITLKEV